jgi:hypothetical protein
VLTILGALAFGPLGGIVGAVIGMFVSRKLQTNATRPQPRRRDEPDRDL